jgi:hypothetical protein
MTLFPHLVTLALATLAVLRTPHRLPHLQRLPLTLRLFRSPALQLLRDARRSPP